jgi:predicted ferric reductase
MRNQITFFIAGFTAGVLTIFLGIASVMFLAFGVGALLFLAIIISVAITRGWSRLIGTSWRYSASFGMFVAAYIVGLFAFLGVMRYSYLVGLPTSTDITQFGADIWLALFAAALFSALCVELAIYFLTNRWSNFYLMRLISAGVVTIALTFASKFLLGEHWSFPSMLFPVGHALFSWTIGAQIFNSAQHGGEPAS